MEKGKQSLSLYQANLLEYVLGITLRIDGVENNTDDKLKEKYDILNKINQLRKKL